MGLLMAEAQSASGQNMANIALHTKGGILLHPGKLARAMIDVLPDNVYLYENSSLLGWKKNKEIISCNFQYKKIMLRRLSLLQTVF